MPVSETEKNAIFLPVMIFLLFWAGTASAQDTEPRRWTNLPVGVNFIGVGYARISAHWKSPADTQVFLGQGTHAEAGWRGYRQFAGGLLRDVLTLVPSFNGLIQSRKQEI